MFFIQFLCVCNPIIYVSKHVCRTFLFFKRLYKNYGILNFIKQIFEETTVKTHIMFQGVSTPAPLSNIINLIIHFLRHVNQLSTNVMWKNG